MQPMVAESPTDAVAQERDLARLHADACRAIDQPLEERKLLRRERFDFPHGVGGLLPPD